MIHQAADALSSLQTTGIGDKPLEDNLPLPAFDANINNTNKPFINANSNDIFPLDMQKQNSIDTPTTVKELITKQALDEYCKTAFLNGGHTGSEVDIDQRGLLVRKAIIKERIQIVAPTLL